MQIIRRNCVQNDLGNNFGQHGDKLRLDFGICFPHSACWVDLHALMSAHSKTECFIIFHRVLQADRQVVSETWLATAPCIRADKNQRACTGFLFRAPEITVDPRRRLSSELREISGLANSPREPQNRLHPLKITSNPMVGQKKRRTNRVDERNTTIGTS